ncbi:MAG: murein L,D-transpeptidase catalytic domain-containing protein [Chitinophagaceae bacterium]
MKPLNKYLSAGSLAAIALFGCIENFNKQSFLAPAVIKTQPVAVAAAQHNEYAQITANTSNPYKPATSTSTYTMARPATAKRLIKVIGKTALTQEDTAGLIDVTTSLPEMVTMQYSASAKTEINVQAAESEDLAADIRNTGGSSYQASTKSPVDAQAFSSIKQADYGADSYSYAAIYDGSEDLKNYAERSGSNADYAIIVNLGIKTGKKRFFVIDLSTNTIIKTAVVAEGSGDIASFGGKKYSNEIGSTSTSLGIFKIGKRATKDAYRLHGLEESNNNAYAREMMLQAADEVPNDEISFPTLKTNGSLALSNSFFKELSVMIEKSAKPVLLMVNDSSAENQGLYSAVQKKD